MPDIMSFLPLILDISVNFAIFEKLLLKNFANSKIIYNFAPKTEIKWKN